MSIFKKRRIIIRRQTQGQITFFAIVGLVLLLLAIAGFFVVNSLRNQKSEGETQRAETISLQAQEIERYISSCISKEAFDGLKRLGQTGGYFELQGLIDFQGVSLWQLDQANIQPFLNQTQERLIAYINANVPKCIETADISRYGFYVDKKEPSTFMEFGASDVTLKVIYPIRLNKTGFSKELNQFFTTFSIRYRQTFEAATEVNERLFDADFDIREPLKKMDYIKGMDFDIQYKIYPAGVIAFTITDKKSMTPENKLYSFNFAAKLGQSELKKITEMQEHSASNPVFLPYTIYSVDKKAQLDISRGTTISLDGKDVEEISVQQSYPGEVIVENVPVYKKNSQIMERKPLTYVIDNPIYTFEPTGLLFNQYEKLTIYYDNETKAGKGVGILMGKNGFWAPIPSVHEPEQKRVYSNIIGFTEFTAVNCASQKVKQSIGEHFYKPTGMCYVSLGAMIIALAAVITTMGAAFGLWGGFISFTPAGIGSSISMTLSNTLGISLSTTLATIVGSMVLAASVFSTITSFGLISTYEDSPDNCQNFVPTCSQNITITKEEVDGTGMCVPEDGKLSVTAGQRTTVCGQVQKCDMLSKFTCRPCSVKCTASYY